MHTRGIDPGLIDELAEPLSALAGDLGLVVEPGRQVIELRAPGIDKGDAVRALVSRLGARQVIFAGDDLGDLPAFAAVEELRDDRHRRAADLLGVDGAGRARGARRRRPRRARCGRRLAGGPRR